jgi:hypothetical protein
MNTNQGTESFQSSIDGTTRINQAIVKPAWMCLHWRAVPIYTYMSIKRIIRMRNAANVSPGNGLCDSSRIRRTSSSYGVSGVGDVVVVGGAVVVGAVGVTVFESSDAALNPIELRAFTVNR